ncbi:MAG: hypothetical protein FWD23_15040 [Oscillospiraceae bacterium]|nr:hypothetical protein [Oscillospiraceae bacterium]
MNNKNIMQNIIDEYAGIDENLNGNVWEKIKNALNTADSKSAQNPKTHKPTKIQRKYYRGILIAAAIALLMSIGVGAYYISTLFFVPGHGILKNADFTIYATKNKVMLGSFVVDAVTRTIDKNESTVCIWLFQSEEIESFLSEEDRRIGLPPAEFTNITAVFDDGTEIKVQPGRIEIPGFSTYICKNTPETNTFRLKDIYGNETRVELEDISKTEYANLKGLKFDDISMTVVPLSGTGNIFAAEIIDEFTLNIGKHASTTGINASFFMESADGETGYASGNAMLEGYNDNYNFHTITANANNYNMDAKRIMLNYIFVMHSFREIKDGYSVIVPNEGETINCNITLFDAEGIKFTIKNIKNENGVLKCETETIDNVKNKHRTKANFYFSIGIYEDYIYEEHDKIKTVNLFAPLTGNHDYDVDNSYDVVWLNLKTNNSTTANPGDELFFQLDSLHYEYQWDKKSERLTSDWWKDPAKNLGVINLR